MRVEPGSLRCGLPREGGEELRTDKDAWTEQPFAASAVCGPTPLKKHFDV